MRNFRKDSVVVSEHSFTANDLSNTGTDWNGVLSGTFVFLSI